MAWPPVDQLADSNSSFGVRMATSRVWRSARKYSSSMPNEYSVALPLPPAERMTRCCLSSEESRRSSFKTSEANVIVHPAMVLPAGDNPPDGGGFRAGQTGNCKVERNNLRAFGRARDQSVIGRHFGPVRFLVERLGHDDDLAAGFAKIQRVRGIVDR